MDFVQRCGWVLTLGGVLFWLGCGGDTGPTRYRVSGQITYGGQPIPAGSVTFIPDTSQDNAGPAGSAKIKDGKYDTDLEGLGVVGGPHVVKITALDGKAEPEFPDGVPMFPTYEMKLDLPKAESVQNLEVPSDWVAPPKKRRVEPSA